MTEGFVADGHPWAGRNVTGGLPREAGQEVEKSPAVKWFEW